MAEKRLRFANSSAVSSQPTQEKRLRFIDPQVQQQAQKEALNLWHQATTIQPDPMNFPNYKSQLRSGNLPKFQPVAVGNIGADGVLSANQQQYDAIMKQRKDTTDSMYVSKAAMTYDEVQAEKNKYAPGTADYEKWDKFSDYRNLEDFDKALADANNHWYKTAEKAYNDWSIPTVGQLNKNATNENGVPTYYTQQDVDAAIKARDDYMRKILGGKSWEEIRDVYDASWIKELETKRNRWELDHAFDKYKHLFSNDDFAKKSQYNPTKKNGSDRDDIYKFINNANGTARLDLQAQHDKLQANAPVYMPSEYAEMFLEELTEDEIQVYNYLYATSGKTAANEFLAYMQPTLGKRASDDMTRTVRKTVDDSAIASALLSAASVPLSVGGGLYAMASGGNPYSIYSSISNLSSDIRKEVGENIAESTEGMEIFGQNIPAFLYNTAMSVGDSALGAVSFGKAFTPIMGTNAYQQTAKELTEAGENKETVVASALASGIAEAVFEYASIDNLLKIKDVSGIKNAITNALKQSVIEGTEETFTEISNILTDTIFRGDTSEISQLYNQLKAQGLSESEINVEIAKHIGGKIGWAFAGGALSGGVTGSGASVTSLLATQKYASAGKIIRDRFGEDINGFLEYALNSPKKDTRQFAEGITNKNLTNRQLGILYNYVVDDVTSVFATANTVKNVSDTMKKFDDAPAAVKVVAFSAQINRMAQLVKDMPEEQQAALGGSMFTPLSAANGEKDAVTKSVEKVTGHMELTADQKELRRIGSQFGARVEFADLDEKVKQKVKVVDKNGKTRTVTKTITVSPEGNYDPDTNTITLNTNAKENHKPLEYILKHEMTHSLENNELYEQFANEVISSQAFKDYVASKNYTSRAEWAKDIIDRYDRSGHPLGETDTEKQDRAMREQIADFVGDMLFGGKTKITEDLMNAMSPKARRSFIEWVQDFWAELKRIFAGKPELVTIEQLEKDFLKLARKVENQNAQQQSVSERTQNAAVNEKTTTEEGESTPQNVNENVEKVNVEIDEKTSDDAKSEGHPRTTNSGIKRFVVMKAKKDASGKLNTSVQGAKVVDGKQYLSYNGFFVVELNNPDETIPNNDDLNVNALKNGFEKAKENSVDGTYNIDVRELSTIAKTLQKGNSNINIVNVGENYFDIKYVNAVLKAIADPEISLSNMFKSHQMLVVKGSNGKALISPMNIPNLNKDGINVVYTSQQSETTNNIQLSLPETDDFDSLIDAVSRGEMSAEEAKRLSKNNKLLNPVEIANTPKSEASTTPKLDKPKMQGEGDGESNLYGSLDRSAIITDEVKEKIKADTYIKNYGTTTNKETLAKAMQRLDEGGAKEVNWWEKTLKPDEANAVNVAEGLILLQRYQDAGDTYGAIAVAEKLREIASASGQTVQIFSVIGRFTPEMMVAYSQHELDKAFEIMQKGRTKAWIEANAEKFQLTKEEKQAIYDKTLLASSLEDGSRVKAIILGEITTMLQNKLPPEKGQALRAWMRISLLFNAKTQLRNILGNASMILPYISSDFFGGLIDAAIAKKTGVRTTGFDAKTFGKSLVQGGKKGTLDTIDDYKRRIHTKAEELNRFETNAGSGKSFNENHQKLVALNKISKVLNEVDRLNSMLLEMGDRPFFEAWFMNALENQMRLNKVSEPTLEMVEMAKQEALQRTWQDNNNYTKAASGLKRALNTVQVGGYGLGDVVLKFVKTPANIFKAMIELSPVGFGSAALKIRDMKVAMDKGEFTPAMQKEVVRSLSNAITGTAIYLLVYALAASGLIDFSGGGDEDKDVSNFEKYILGIPPYSFKFLGMDVNYTWNQPIGTVLAVVSDIMEDAEDGDISGWDAISTVGTVFTSQSFLSNLYEFFSKDDPLTGLVSAAFSEPSAAIPTLLAQMASVTDPYRRTSYDPSHPFQSAIKDIIYRVPILRTTLPKQVNVLGQDAKNPQFANIWKAFASPSTHYPKADMSVMDVSTEVYALYQATSDKTVMPRVAPNKVTIKGKEVKFSVDEKADFQRRTGELSVEILREMFALPEYDKLTDEEKTDAVAKVYNYVSDKAKSELDIYDYETLSAMEGTRTNGEPVLKQSTYDRMNEKAKQMLVDEYFFSKDERNCKGDPKKLAKLFVKKAKD